MSIPSPAAALRQGEAQTPAQGREELARFGATFHDRGPSKRAAVYQFFAREFKLPPAPTEANVTLETAETLRVFSPSHPRPAHAVTDPAAIEALLPTP